MAKYEVMVDTLGANPTFSKGDIIEDSGEMKPPYDFGHLVRTGAIRKLGDGTATTVASTPVEPALVAPVAAMPTPPPATVAEASPMGEPSTGTHAVGALDVLDADQQAALSAAGFGSADAIRAASDEDLLKVEGIGPATLRKLREATQA
jgi:hypothetical protein